MSGKQEKRNRVISIQARRGQQAFERLAQHTLDALDDERGDQRLRHRATIAWFGIVAVIVLLVIGLASL